MTKGVAAVAAGSFAAVLLALLAVPGVAAHGAPPVRDIDARLLLDDDGALGYGGCVEGACAVPSGLDLLALDVREAAFPDGEPAVVFRLVFQSEESPAGRSLSFAFTKGSTEHIHTLASADGAAWASPDLDRLEGPFDVGDGHPKALDAWIRYSTHDLAAGDELSGFTVSSAAGDAPDDVMPGGWFLQGAVEVPALSEAGPSGASVPTYVLAGPAPLVTLAVSASPVAAPGTVTLVLANPVGFPQFVDLAVEAPAGVTARLGQAGVALDPNGSREVQLALTAGATGTVRVVATSDLGAHVPVTVEVLAPPPANATSPSATPTTSQAASKDAPLPALALPALALAVALLSSRRLLR